MQQEHLIATFFETLIGTRGGQILVASLISILLTTLLLELSKQISAGTKAIMLALQLLHISIPR